MPDRILRLAPPPPTPPKIWFTADTHFGHARVIEYSKRPFKDVDEMDQALVENWRSCVSDSDRIYHLGDFSFHRDDRTVQILRRLPGQKFLIAGNHDAKRSNMLLRTGAFEWIRDYHELSVADPDAVGGKQKLILCHYAFTVWNKSHYGSWNLHGHSHGSLPVKLQRRQLDVGVDVHGYRPIEYAEVKAIMAGRTFQSVDHHGAEPGP